MSGRLRHRVTIQTHGIGVDAVGQQVDTWTTVKSVWAEIKPAQGREYYTASSERAELTHEIFMRAGVTVRPRDRIVFGSRTFDVEHVANMYEMDRFLRVMVKERAAT